MAKRAEDRFEAYLNEKLWELVPSVYRHEDGIAENPDVLRALIEVIAEQAALLRRDIDRLWEDFFIESCDDWTVPYIADLVATRLVSALNKRARRVDVAKTIYYRRRKGTLRILEELISDIASWEGKVVENFKRLARTRHRLDPQPAQLAGIFSGTLPGGWADLREQRISELAGGPFSEFHYTVDVRQHKGLHGRYGIPKLAFHLYRLTAFKVEGVTPHKRPGGKAFTFDPSGRDVALFMPRNRPEDWDEWRTTREWDLPSPLRCRLLAHAEYEITESLVKDLIDNNGLSAAAAAELRTFHKRRFRSESHLREFLGILAHSAEFLSGSIYFPMLRGAIIDECGKKALLPRALEVKVGTPGTGIAAERIVAGNLDGWSAAAPGKKLVVDPERGRLLFLGAPGGKVTLSYHYGFSGEIGAGSYDRRYIEDSEPSSSPLSGGGPILAGQIENDGVTQVNDSATYGPLSDKLSVKNITVQAANFGRPYLRLESNWVFNTGENKDAKLVLDGLWIGSSGDFDLILRGNYEQVVINHVTLDPGGKNADGNAIHPVSLIVEAQIEELVINASITGPIRTQNGGIIEKVVIHDSILQSIDSDILALSQDGGEAEMRRVTVFGAMRLHRLWASELLATGKVDVTDTQTGCFRFSAAPEGSRLPRPYESHFIKDSNHYFSSRIFGKPGYGQLSQTAPEELLCGAENGSEIGAFSGFINPIKLESLRAKVEEYMPFGLIPIFIQET